MSGDGELLFNDFKVVKNQENLTELPLDVSRAAVFDFLNEDFKLKRTHEHQCLVTCPALRVFSGERKLIHG